MAGKTILEQEIRTWFNVNIIGLKSIRKEDDGNEVSTTDYVGFENTVLNINYSLLVVSKETNLAELVRISGRSS